MIITFFLYDGVTALDVAGLNEILSRLPDAYVQFAAKYPGEIKTDSRYLRLVATHDLVQITRTDVLIIPGSTATFLEVIQDKFVLSWIKNIHANTILTAAVSSGTIILAAAGLLKGRKATSHWYSQRFLAEYGVDIVEERYVEDGKIFTSSGSSSSLDLGLVLADKLSDRETAKALQLMIEYYPHPPFNSGSLSKATKETMILAKKKLKEDALKSGIFGII